MKNKTRKRDNTSTKQTAVNTIVDFVTTGGDTAISIFTKIPVPFLSLSKSAIAGIVSTYSSYKGEIFSEKLQAFFEGSGRPTKEDVRNFVSLLDKDQDEFFKRLFTVLERLDGKEKSEILGKLFKNTMSGKISPNDFLMLCATIDKTFTTDLEFFIRAEKNLSATEHWLKDFGSDDKVSAQRRLANVGLLYEKVTVRTDKGANMIKGQTDSEFILTSIGKILIENT